MKEKKSPAEEAPAGGGCEIKILSVCLYTMWTQYPEGMMDYAFRRTPCYIKFVFLNNLGFSMGWDDG